MKEKVKNENVFYGVPGHPAVAETTVQLLLKENVKVEILGGKSFIDDLFSAVEMDPINGFQLVDSFDLEIDKINPRNQLVVMQVFNSFMASEVKLNLMEIYPAEHEVAVIDGAGSKEEKVQWIPLYELDYFEGIYNLRSLYLPALKRDQAIYSFSTLQSYVDEIFSETGDLWVREQTGESLLKYFQEELDELKAAYEKDDIENIVEELGDLLMQIIYQATIGEKENIFSLEEILAGMNQKLRRRHPHVFDGVKAETIEEVEGIWQAIKKEEKREE
ncbi:MAG: SAM-dependent methyltransferase [Atopostipes suicloacalis]|nr:SAM-dependent methyltransferase [Atopostipes suicloacalis]